MAFSSSLSSRRWNFDVFLSYRGSDTRKTFTDHLYSALKTAGINTFHGNDDNEATRADSEILRAIEGSRVCVIVFSENYAGSRRCLEELAKIIECRKAQGQRCLVLPVFYGVDPSDVRNQRGSFALLHEVCAGLEMLEVARWKEALTVAANLSGWDLSKTCNGYEGKFIKKIVEKILLELNHTYLHVANHPVGLDSRVWYMNSLLRLGSNDVCIVGIWGMGGIGKTTIAKAIYNQFFHYFDGTCFLENVREVSKQPGGLIRLQEQLLSDIFQNKKVKVGNVERGINVIKERLRNRRVLVVIDDVDQVDQLNTIAQKRDWFGSGSRLILTTRDKHLLQVIEVDEMYRAEELNVEESQELFNWHAFEKNNPVEDYAELSKDVISYSAGIPLALEVLGSFLRGKTMPEWKDALEKLRRIPNDKILKMLRISIDALEVDHVKDVFLDIACFFIGEDRDYVIKILDGCGLSATTGIGVLARRRLVAVSGDNKLRMHDMLRDTGREIVREESFKYPGKRSRLWSPEDVLNVLQKHSGTDAIEGLTLNMPGSNGVDLQTEAFAKMQKLRLLKLNHVHLKGDYGHLSDELRWLCWHGFPLEYIPNSFYQGNLVSIDMQYSKLKQVWQDNKVLEKLEVLNLSHSHYLTKGPNFLMLPNLETLILKDCKSLVEIHQSIGSLEKLVLLNVKDCPYLKNLPRSICKLKSLEILKLSGCSTIDTLPEDIGDMESLTKLLADATAIRQVPFSILRLKNLQHLSLCRHRGPPSNSLSTLIWSWLSPRKNPDFNSLLPTSLSGLASLTKLSLEGCSLSQDAFPNDLGSLSCLEDLVLSGNNFVNLPASISHLSNLRGLSVNGCSRLQSLPELPASLLTLSAISCSSLETLSTLSNFRSAPELYLGDCNKLIEVPGLEKLQPSRVWMEGCNSLSNTFKETLLRFHSSSVPFHDPRIQDGGIFLPGKDIPDWFSFQSMGSSLSFLVPVNPEYTMTGFAICITYAVTLKNTWASPVITVLNRINKLHSTHEGSPNILAFTRHDHLWMCSLPLYKFGELFQRGDMVDVKVDLGEGVIVKKCGVHLVCEQAEKVTKSSSGEVIELNSSDSKSVVMIDDGMNVSAPQLAANGKRGHEDDDGPNGSGKDQQLKRLRC